MELLYLNKEYIEQILLMLESYDRRSGHKNTDTSKLTGGVEGEAKSLIARIKGFIRSEETTSQTVDYVRSPIGDFLEYINSNLAKLPIFKFTKDNFNLELNRGNNFALFEGLIKWCNPEGESNHIQGSLLCPAICLGQDSYFQCILNISMEASCWNQLSSPYYKMCKALTFWESGCYLTDSDDIVTCNLVMAWED